MPTKGSDGDAQTQVELEARLRESEERLKAVLDGIGEAYYALDSDWRFLFASRSALEMWGKRQEDILGRPLLDCFPRVAGSKPYEAHRRVMATGVAERLETISPVLGRWIEIDIKPSTAGGLSVAFRDIEARKLGESALGESEERFAKFAASSSDALWIRSAETWAFEYASPAVQAIYGVSPEAVVADARLLNDLIVLEERDGVSMNVERVGGGEVIVQEYRIRRATDRALRWIRSTGFPLHDEDGRVRRIGAIAQDITDRKLAEEALRASEARYRHMLDTMNAAFAVFEAVRDSDGTPVDVRIVETDAALQRVTGLSPTDVQDKLLTEILPESDARAWIDAFTSVLASGKPAYAEHEIAALGRWFSSDIIPYGPDRVAHVYVNITERKNAELAEREGEERQAFLLKLSDALRAETGVEAVGNRAVRMIADQLGADRVYLVALTAGDDKVVVTHETRREHMPPMFGSYRGSDFPSAMREIFERTLVYEDIRTDARLSEPERLAFAALGAVGFIAAPIRKGSEGMVWAAGALSTQPRSWSTGEIALFEDAVERTWAAVERARVEAALRAREADLARVQRIGRVGGVDIEVAAGLRSWRSPEYRKLHGLPDDVGEETHEQWRQRVFPADRERAEQTLFEALEGEGATYESEYRIVRPSDGAVRWIHARADIDRDAEGKAVRLVGAHIDVTEQRQIQDALRRSEERLRQFGDASQDVLWIRDAQTLRWVYLTPAFETIYGISREDALGAHDFQTWTNFILPEDREHAIDSIARVREGENVAFEFRIRRPSDGEIRWMRNTDFPITDETGKVTLIGGVGHDITPLKAAEEHQKLLLAELQHRVRNTLAVIRSIVRRTAEQSHTLEENTAHLEGRINAFARVQAAVTRDPAGGIELGSIVAEELRAAGAREGENLTIGGAPLALKPKAAETVGLAVHELTTNALKYGALATRSGSIAVEWRVEDDMLRFAWTEAGMAGLKPPERRGFGLEILERTLPYELRASVDLRVEPGGLRFEAAIPLAAIRKPD